ncbi:MAG: efflux RND transporter permease subunit [Planctomycetes bacterium]|nr:efflux RND transporter permease subunit [Planctomycetota bacterium]
MNSLPRISVRNPILVNLLMYSIIISGVYCAFTLVREMFPEIRPKQVMITTPYPGASPTEVEKGITIKIEEQIKNIEGVETITSTIREGSSSIAAKLYNDFDDVDRVVTDIKNAIDTIPRDDFPSEAEETVVARLEPLIPVISASLFGDLTDRQLKTFGKRLRDDILALPGVTEVTLSGTRRDEISVEVRPEQLVRYGLSFEDISDAIRRGNMDLPGGQIKTGRANLSVRTLGEKDVGTEIEDLIIKADTSGRVVRLRDIATVIDGFEDTDLVSRMDGKPGVSVMVSKTGEQDAIEISRKVKTMVAGKMHEPPEIPWSSRLTGQSRVLRKIYDDAFAAPYTQIGSLKTHSDSSVYIEGRLSLLTRNGLWGLLFVFLSLLFFLNWRVAFWVMTGLLLAILGTFCAMKVAGITLNLITMFSLIVVLGMLVDDAIIVGEHIYTKIEEGVEPELAAITAAEEVTFPVSIAIATTIIAFVPLLFVKGMMGDFMRVLPMIVMCSLAISLFEALTILPSHLAESFTKSARRAKANPRPPGVLARLTDPLREKQVWFVDQVVKRRYRSFLSLAIEWRYVTFAAAIGALMVTVGMIGGGKVPIVMFQSMDADSLVVAMELPVGSPMKQTEEKMRLLEEATADIPEISSRFSLIGAQVNMDMEGGGSSASNMAQMIIELVPGESRERSSDELATLMRERTANITGLNSLTFRAVHGGPGGAPIQIEISGEDPDELLGISNRIKSRLREFDGVYDIEDDFDSGQREVRVELLASGHALGLTTQSLATQVRAAFYGLEARKIQRDREDVKIMVRYPAESRSKLADLERMRIATPSGASVPIGEVASITEGVGFATIRRKDQLRTITVKGDIDETRANSRDVLAAMQPDFDRFKQTHARVNFSFGGQSDEWSKSMGSIIPGGALALGGIYVLLVALFKSYTQPVIVMSAIPFGLVGAVIGHYLMGYPLTMLSIIGLVALTGIVVNDSLILVSFINQRTADGLGLKEAVVDGGSSRLRAILLTSITTILGLAPLLSETSFQARFLIPMGVSIASGLAFATVLTLVLVPCLCMIESDIRHVGRALWAVIWPSETETLPVGS